MREVIKHSLAIVSIPLITLWIMNILGHAPIFESECKDLSQACVNKNFTCLKTSFQVQQCQLYWISK